MNFIKKIFSSVSSNETPLKESSVPSKPRPTYSAPLFAQPGEVSTLFAYANFEKGELLDGLFTIIDVETSSLTPKDGYVIEVGINQIDKTGKIIREFSSLIKPPNGQVGKTDVHGIRKSDLKNAPKFSDVAGDILEIFQDTILVAHNARFEERFLKSEFARNEINLPIMPAIDTLWLSRQVIDLHNYKLNTVVEGFGEKILNAHTALGDTRAVAKILPKMLKNASELKFPVNFQNLPRLAKTGKVKTR